MEKHKCKLCDRTFSNGRSLGGHMKAHLTRQQQLSDHHTESASSSHLSSSEEEKEEKKNVPEIGKESEFEEKILVYELRGNPKKSFKLADPEFFLVHNKESEAETETETKSRNFPLRRRSKRDWKLGFEEKQNQNMGSKKVRHLKNRSEKAEPVTSVMSGSDTTTTATLEEYVAKSLMMLSRDSWIPRNEANKIITNKLINCEKCTRNFGSLHALNGHKRSCFQNRSKKQDQDCKRIFKCPFCFRLFVSGQALGGHKRSHLMASTAISTTTEEVKKLEDINLIDLNLPAPLEDDDFSVVSDA